MAKTNSKWASAPTPTRLLAGHVHLCRCGPPPGQLRQRPRGAGRGHAMDGLRRGNRAQRAARGTPCGGRLLGHRPRARRVERPRFAPPLRISNVQGEACAQCTVPLPRGGVGAAYVLDGRIALNGQVAAGKEMLVLDGASTDDALRLRCDEPARVLFLSGAPLGAPCRSRHFGDACTP